VLYNKKQSASNAFLSAVWAEDSKVFLARRSFTLPAQHEPRLVSVPQIWQRFFAVSGSWTSAGYGLCQFTKCWPAVVGGNIVLLWSQRDI